jgi:hypothetical protein
MALLQVEMTFSFLPVPIDRDPSPNFLRLEAGVEAESEASCGSDRIAGEETTEIDYIEPVVKIVPIGLKASVDLFAFVDVDT